MHESIRNPLSKFLSHTTTSNGYPRTANARSVWLCVPSPATRRTASWSSSLTLMCGVFPFDDSFSQCTHRNRSQNNLAHVLLPVSPRSTSQPQRVVIDVLDGRWAHIQPDNGLHSSRVFPRNTHHLLRNSLTPHQQEMSWATACPL